MEECKYFPIFVISPHILSLYIYSFTPIFTYFPILVISPHSQDLNPLDRPQTLKCICHRLQI